MKNSNRFEDIFKILHPGLFTEVTLPCYGQQDIGISPAGCMDRLAFDVGNLLLDNPMDHPALEMIFAPRLRLRTQMYFVLTGARHQQVRLVHNHGEQSVNHARVYLAPAGSTLIFGDKNLGLRTYLCWRTTQNHGLRQDLIGRERGSFNRICQWLDPDGKIRVVQGPEFSWAGNPESFCDQAWKITNDSNHIGLRLQPRNTAMRIDTGNMISAPVSDGTVQLTPKGPIILLRHRQTIGGYPRIYNVISADLDLLAQYAPGQLIHFKKTTIEKARVVARQKHTVLQNLMARFRSGC